MTYDIYRHLQGTALRRIGSNVDVSQAAVEAQLEACDIEWAIEGYERCNSVHEGADITVIPHGAPFPGVWDGAAQEPEFH